MVDLLGDEGREHRERRYTLQGRRRSKDAVKANVERSSSDPLTRGVVVIDEVILLESERLQHGPVRQIENGELGDRDAPEAAFHFHWMDAVVFEVTKQFGPRRLSASRGVPTAHPAQFVVAAFSDGGIGEVGELTSRRTLVPVLTAQRTRRKPTYRRLEVFAQRYVPSTKARAASRTRSY
jgi:hypothetical protein